MGTGCYTLYHYGASPAATRRLFGLADADTDALRTAVAYWRKILGFLVLGVVPAIVTAVALPGGLSAHGLTLRMAGLSLAVTAGAAAALTGLLWISSRKPWFHAHYPEVRARRWGPRVIALDAGSWLLYLCAYELFFRGFLLFALAHAFGPWPAIAMTTALYVAVHLPKNPGEGLGSAVNGVGLAFVALTTGSLLMPILTHWITAVAADLLAVRHSPTMAFGGAR